MELNKMILFAFWIYQSSRLLSIVCYELQLGKPGQPLERFNGTCGLRNLPIVSHYYSLKIEGSRVWVNASIDIKEDITTDPIFNLKITKCKNADNLDTCEQLPDIKHKNVCTFFDPINPIWGPLFSVMDPPIRCPLKKNVHRSNHGQIDLKMLIIIPTQQEYWKVKVELKHHETHRVLLCAIMESHIFMKW